MAPRWEFRVFGATLAAERETLRRIAERGDEEARADIYFVVPDRTNSSLKLREDRLDLKLLRDERDGLELWQPAGRAEFPVEPDRLRDELLGPAGVRLDLPDAPVGHDLLLALAGKAPVLRLVRVEKHRRQYRLDAVMAELTRISADGRTAESVAVEDADLGRTNAAVAALRIDRRRNTSYQRWLVESFPPVPGRIDRA